MLHTLLLLLAAADPGVVVVDPAGVVEADAWDPAEWSADPSLPPPPLDEAMKARSKAVTQKSHVKDVPVVADAVVDHGGAVVLASACAGGVAVCAIPFGLPGVIVALGLPLAVGGGAALAAGKEPTTAVGTAVGAALGTAVGGVVGIVAGTVVGIAASIGAGNKESVGPAVIGAGIGVIAGAASGAAGGAAIALAVE